MIPGAAVLVAAYLLGGVPFGYLLYRLSHGRDIRREGSGNIGATNMVRSAGWRLGVLTLLLDAAKGALSVWTGMAVTGSAAWGAAAGMAAVAGHCHPVWLRFRGGKGVATGCGAFLVIQPAGMVAALAVFALVLGLWRVVAAASILASLSFPAVSAALGAPGPVVAWSSVACVLIIVRHHENIRRLLRGQEGRMFGNDGGKGGS